MRGTALFGGVHGPIAAPDDRSRLREGIQDGEVREPSSAEQAIEVGDHDAGHLARPHTLQHTLEACVSEDGATRDAVELHPLGDLQIVAAGDLPTRLALGGKPLAFTRGLRLGAHAHERNCASLRFLDARLAARPSYHRLSIPRVECRPQLCLALLANAHNGAETCL